MSTYLDIPSLPENAVETRTEIASALPLNALQDTACASDLPDGIPDDAGERFYSLGVLHEMGEAWDEAVIRQLTEQENSRDPWSHERLGYILYQQQDWAGAADAYQQAIDLAYSDEAVGHLIYAQSWLLAELNRDDPALLRKCKKLGRDENNRLWAAQQLEAIEQPDAVGE